MRLLLSSLRRNCLGKVDMHAFVRNASLFLLFCSIVLCWLVPSVDSVQDYSSKMNENRKDGDQYSPLKLTYQLSLQIKIHAFLLWGSVGFLMPVGILVIRFASSCNCRENFQLLFYFHVILQSLAVVLATVGAILSIRNFENSFNNTHQKIGLGLYGLILFQPLVGFFRPKRGMKLRSIWYFIHWLIGIGTCIIGIANIYIGLHTYHERTARSVKMWIVLFTIEICLVGFVYLLQDRWSYVLKQGAILGDEQIRPTDHVMSPSNSSHKEHMVIC
ncbi:hypothetical protein LUZ60_008194 [Juncus effusus]|nr:hypothetical protein LUZ60_008194 [Juncus effusus]